MDYVVHILTILVIYGALAKSLDLLVGVSGLASLSQAAFFGVGAYAGALSALRWHASFFGELCFVVVVAAALAALTGLIALRVRGDSFAIATFCLQMVILGLLTNWTSVTGGTLGIDGIPAPRVFGVVISSRYALFLVALLVSSGVFGITEALSRAPYGRLLRVIREDEVLAVSRGKRPAVAKLSAFMVVSVMAGACGVVYAHFAAFIDPSSFHVMESMLILSMVIIGGRDTLWGGPVGAVVLTMLPECLSWAHVPSPMAFSVRRVVYGAALVLILIKAPQGLTGSRRPNGDAL
jgi:branched-chain amino acid transport system permease protein